LIPAAQEELGRAQGPRRHDHEPADDATGLEALLRDVIEVHTIAAARLWRDGPHEMTRPDLGAVGLRDVEVVLVECVFCAQLAAEVTGAEASARALPCPVHVQLSD